MEKNIALVLLLAGGLLAGAGPATSERSAAPPSTRLPVEVPGGVVVDLADGDRFKVTIARNQRTVWGTTYDAGTRSWTERRAIFREKDVFCGDVDARGAGTSVAVIAECDRGGYSEDTAPTHSQALYSPDTVTWQAFTLPGEGHEEPGISPSGNAAVWPLHQQWVTWTSEGFRTVRHALPGQEYSVTGTISDAGDVSLLYGARASNDAECVLHVLTVPTAGPEVRQELAVDNACQDYGLTNADATTAYFGEPDSPHWLTTITRPDTASGWAVTEIPPEGAPGLVRHRGRGTAPTVFAHAPGLPLVAVGSPDRRSFEAQTYDAAAQRWSPPRSVGKLPTCTWARGLVDQGLAVLALRLRCRGKDRALVSTDAAVWRHVGLGHRPLGVSADGAYVAAASSRRTLVFSRERGIVRLPLGTRARCDVVSPVGPDAAVRLSTTRSRGGWPGVLHESTANGWRRTDTAFPRLRVGTDRCRNVRLETWDGSISYFFRGRTHGVSLSIESRGTGWKVRRG